MLLSPSSNERLSGPNESPLPSFVVVNLEAAVSHCQGSHLCFFFPFVRSDYVISARVGFRVVSGVVASP